MDSKSVNHQPLLGGTAIGSGSSEMSRTPTLGGSAFDASRRARNGSTFDEVSSVQSINSLQSEFNISDYKGHVTLQQAKWLFEAEVREEENKPCCRVYWVLWTVFILLTTAVVLALTVFHDQLSPHYSKILELGSIPFVCYVLCCVCFV